MRNETHGAFNRSDSASGGGQPEQITRDLLRPTVRFRTWFPSAHSPELVWTAIVLLVDGEPMMTPTRGVSVSQRTQCAHYSSEHDIVALKFKCCGEFYACIFCHHELADHAPIVWGRNERETQAVLCGNCGGTLSIAEYLGCENRCPHCRATFNPGCANHHQFYFET